MSFNSLFSAPRSTRAIVTTYGQTSEKYVQSDVSTFRQSLSAAAARAGDPDCGCATARCAKLTELQREGDWALLRH
jgi:hypothetical protein